MDSKNSLITCPKHRKYKAIQQPRVNCTTCWNIYAEKRIDAEYKRARDRVDEGNVRNK